MFKQKLEQIRNNFFCLEVFRSEPDQQHCTAHTKGQVKCELYRYRCLILGLATLGSSYEYPTTPTCFK